MCSVDLQSNTVESRLQIGDQDAAVPSIRMDPNNENLAYCCSSSDTFLLDRRKVLPLLLMLQRREACSADEGRG